MESGDLDLAFCSAPAPDGPFEALELMSDPYVLVVPADHELAGRRERVARRSRRPRVDRLEHLLQRRRRRGGAARVSGTSSGYAFRSDDNGTVQGLVAAGFGAALVPLLAVTPGDDAGSGAGARAGGAAPP